MVSPEALRDVPMSTQPRAEARFSSSHKKEFKNEIEAGMHRELTEAKVHT